MKTIRVDHPLISSIVLFDQPPIDGDRAPIEEPHLSASQLRIKGRCGVQYYLRYAAGLNTPPSPSLIKGTAFHAGMAAWKTAGIRNEDIDAERILESANRAIEAELGKHESPLPDEDINEIYHDVQRAINLGLSVFATEKPLAVERGFLIRWKNSDVLPIAGFVDEVHERDSMPVPRDYKTSKRSKSQAEADLDIGLTVYGTGFRLLYKMPVIDVEMAAAILTKDVKSQLLPSVRDDSDTRILYRAAATATRVIARGDYEPSLDPMICNMCDLTTECRTFLTRPISA